MSYINIDHNKCTGCGECAANCPFGVIRLQHADDNNTSKAIIGQGCRLCSTCEMVCDQEAITFVSSDGVGTIKESSDFHF